MKEKIDEKSVEEFKVKETPQSELNQAVEEKDKSSLSMKKVIVATAVALVVLNGVAVGSMLLNEDENIEIVYEFDGKRLEIKLDQNKKLYEQELNIPGYEFGGWFLDEELTKKIDDSYVVKKNSIVYPMLIPKSYKVEYYSNDGTGQMMFQDVIFKEEYTLINNEYSKENYEFVGWSENQNAHYNDLSLLDSGEIEVLKTEGVKYYAIWKGVSKNIIFNTRGLNVDGNDYVFSNLTCPYGEKFFLPKIEGQITNSLDNSKKFAGYLINGEVYLPGDEITITEDIQISINWEEYDSILYFNLNLPVGETADALDPLSFSSQMREYIYSGLPRPSALINYEFKCWNTKVDGSGIDYYLVDNFSTTEQSNVLYAVWVGKLRVINIHNRGEIVDTINLKFGDTLNLPEFSLENYTFVGFNDMANFTGAIYKGSISVLFESSVVDLYAEYERNQTKIYFNPNGGVGSILAMDVNTNETYTFKASEITAQKESFTREYYTLVGWSTNKDALIEEASFSVNIHETSVELYAIWVRNTSKISFISDGQNLKNMTVLQGEEFVLDSDIVTKDGFAIEYFICNGYRYEVAEDILVKDANVEIEVVWRELGMLKFDCGVDDVNLTTFESVSLASIEEGDSIYAPTVPAEQSYYDKSGVRYYFAGWSKNKNATKPDVFIGESIITATSQVQRFYGIYMPASDCFTYGYEESWEVSLNASACNLEEGDVLVIPNITDNDEYVKVVARFDNIGAFRVVIPEGIETVRWSAFESSSVISVAIPSTVTLIGSDCFYACKNIKTVTFSEASKLETIETSAFHASNIEYIKIPVGVKSITESCFADCVKLKAIKFAEGINLSKLKESAFAGSGLTSIEIPASVRGIDVSCFSNCLGLSSVTFEPLSKLLVLHEYAFAGTAISSIEIPSKVKVVGAYCFENCTNLKTVLFPENSETNTFNMSAFAGSGIESIEIPASIIIVEESCFENCSNLHTVTFLEGSLLEEIGNYAFRNCLKLTNVILQDECPLQNMSASVFENTSIVHINIPSAVISIGQKCFYSCSSLKSVTFAEDSQLTEIGQYSFSKTSIESIEIPMSLTKIGSNSFYECASLRMVIFDKNSQLTEIGAYAFGYTAIENIEIPASVTKIGYQCFCESLKTVTFAEGCKLTKFDNFAFAASNIESIEIPASVTELCDQCFSGCSNLKVVTFEKGSQVTRLGFAAFNQTIIESIEIPASVTKIDSYCFNNCITLKTVIFEEGSELTEICNNAFSGTGIEEMEIPAKVTKIANNSFYNCNNLKEITFKPYNVPTINGGDLVLNDEVIIYIPKDSSSDYYDVFSKYGDRVRECE